MDTYVAANAVSTMDGIDVEKISPIIVFATPNTPIPALTLQNKFVHNK